MNIRRRRYLSAFLAAACTAVLLAGCGKDGTVHTGVDAQTEAGADNAAEETTEDTADGKKEDIAGTSDTMERQGQTSASRAQMEIDEETRKELTAELLEEENLDTSVMEPKRTTKGCSFEIPEGFEESEEVENLYVPKRYPIDASTIYYAVMEEDISLQLLTRESFKEQTEANLKQVYGEDVEVSVDSFERIRISGYPAFRILCRYPVGGVEITQLEYAVNADKSYVVTYSQTSDYDYMEAYEASAATICVE